MNFHNKISSEFLTGIFVTICVVVVASFFSILALPARIFTPLPILFYRLKLGRKHSYLLFLIVAIAAIFIFNDFAPSSLSVIILMFIGMILGELFEISNFSIETTILVAVGTTLLFIALCFIMYSFKNGLNINSLAFSYIDKNIDVFLKICKDSNIANEMIATLEKEREYIITFTLLTLPASITISTILITWINVISAKPLLMKYKIEYPRFDSLNKWSVKDNLIWGLIGFGLAILVTRGLLQYISINGALVLITGYLLQGVAILSFYMSKKNFFLLAKIIIYSIIIVNQILLLSLIIVGILDIWFDFRKIKIKDDVVA